MRKALLAGIVAVVAIAGAVAAMVFAAGGGGSGSARQHSFVVGSVDDALAQQDPGFAQSQVDLSRDAGFDAAIVSATWSPGQRAPDASTLAVLHNVARATARAHMQLWIMIWHGLARSTPKDASERANTTTPTATQATIGTTAAKPCRVPTSCNVAYTARPITAAAPASTVVRPLTRI